MKLFKLLFTDALPPPDLSGCRAFDALLLMMRFGENGGSAGCELWSVPAELFAFAAIVDEVAIGFVRAEKFADAVAFVDVYCWVRI